MGGTRHAANSTSEVGLDEKNLLRLSQDLGGTKEPLAGEILGSHGKARRR